MSDMLERLIDVPMALSGTPMLAVGLTLGAFLAGNWVFTRMNRPMWLPPVVISALLLSAVIALLPISYGNYREGAEWLTVLLGPATVARAVRVRRSVWSAGLRVEVGALCWRPFRAALPLVWRARAQSSSPPPLLPTFLLC